MLERFCFTVTKSFQLVVKEEKAILFSFASLSHINFENYKYNLAVGRKDNFLLEKLYHQSFSADEINEVAEVMTENLVEDIENNVDRPRI